MGHLRATPQPLRVMTRAVSAFEQPARSGAHGFRSHLPRSLLTLRKFCRIRVSSTPPGIYGGNLDLKDLTKGATLFLPVFQPGAQFVVGDGHSGQGDGEVNGTAIETSLTSNFQFILHKGKRLEVPRAETKNHYILMGLDVDLNQAMKKAVQETVKFLVEEKGLNRTDAYSLASIAVDFKVAEAVDQMLLIVGMVPKKIFKNNPEYWYRE